jgi:hypothetical protein
MKTRFASLSAALLWVMVAAALLASALPVFGQAPGLERKIVVFQEWVVNEPAQEAIVRGVGGYVIKPLPLINGMAVALPSPAVGALSRRAAVRRIDDDLTIFAIGRVWVTERPGILGKPPPPPQPAQTIPWGIARIDAPSA